MTLAHFCRFISGSSVPDWSLNLRHCQSGAEVSWTIRLWLIGAPQPVVNRSHPSLTGKLCGEGDLLCPFREITLAWHWHAILEFNIQYILIYIQKYLYTFHEQVSQSSRDSKSCAWWKQLLRLDNQRMEK